MSGDRAGAITGPADGAASAVTLDDPAGDADAGTAGGWKLTLPCTRAEAEAIDGGGGPDLDPMPTLTTSEVVLDDVMAWRLDAYFENEPDAATVAAIRALVPSAADTVPVVAPLPAQDWVTLSQAGLEPIREGRFVVHTRAFPAEAPAGGRAFLIEAGQAFGTGHHETTAGCLAMLDAMADRGFRKVVDLGTGSGLLAFAAAELWPEAAVTATDIDPVAVAVTRENADLNGVEGIVLAVADGARGETVAARAPFDLVIANILAGPLIAMAPEIAGVAAPGATVVLAGLLSTQADAVVAAYCAAGCDEEQRLVRGDWTILRLTAGNGSSGGGETSQERRGDWATDGA